MTVPAIVKKRILVVEDEMDIRDLMVLHLNREAYQVEAVADGEAGMKKIHEAFDLLVLDWMLPGVSGIELTKTARGNSTVPILMVTARVEPADVVLGLEAGADDYITKPFEIPVFLARVRALLRRASLKSPAGSLEGGKNALPSHIHEMGGIRLDENSYDVQCDGAPIQLTHSEFKLLVALIKNQGRVLTRAGLIDLVQGSDVSVVDRTIDTHVFGLRKKLGPYGDRIETVRGVGYRVKGEA
jgi:two-component system phosphate regulon response regulator PhoB